MLTCHRPTMEWNGPAVSDAPPLAHDLVQLYLVHVVTRVCIPVHVLVHLSCSCPGTRVRGRSGNTVVSKRPKTPHRPNAA
jgi:hypothetical protein